ncbi:TrkA family potassium uptake protein [Bacteroidetes/Chlorobi group bacterium MS-B_bin-24]|jgi:trk system potassium uptake protein TrkA|nr:MAG: TrkA family potassium uptake protein [Bacteroidetes/Chlorobi group bacterium MS-B_bin-24]
MTKKFCVIGLGYFGMHLALRLSELGAEVLAIDNHQDVIDKISDRVAHAVCMNATDERALRSLGLKDMDAVIVAIGEGFESSIMTTAILQEIGVKTIYNRVTSPIHERILRLMNVTGLLLPEADAAEQLASRLMLPGVLHSYLISEEYGIFEIETPEKFYDKTLAQINLRKNYNLNLVTLKKLKKSGGLLSLGEYEEYEVLGVPTPDLILSEGTIMVLFGKEDDVKNLLNV